MVPVTTTGKAPRLEKPVIVHGASFSEANEFARWPWLGQRTPTSTFRL
jgi:hypothetical protein